VPWFLTYFETDLAVDQLVSADQKIVLDQEFAFLTGEPSPVWRPLAKVAASWGNNYSGHRDTRILW
jgi:hypothetical protein